MGEREQAGGKSRGVSEDTDNTQVKDSEMQGKTIVKVKGEFPRSGCNGLALGWLPFFGRESGGLEEIDPGCQSQLWALPWLTGLYLTEPRQS
jgi:hypothetical protein